MAEFQYTIEHRAGPRHGNADGLSRQCCSECRQCKRIERRDGGPSREELCQESEQGQDESVQCGFCSCNWDTDRDMPGVPPVNDYPQNKLSRNPALIGYPYPELNGYPYPTDNSTLQNNCCSEVKQTLAECSSCSTLRDWYLDDLAVVTKVLDLKQEQSQGLGVVAQIYQMIKTQVDIAPEMVQRGGHELQQLYRMKDSMRINKDGILEVRFVEKERKMESGLPGSYPIYSDLADTQTSPFRSKPDH